MLRKTSISLSVILLAAGARVFSGLTAPPEMWPGAALAAGGAAVLVSVSSRDGLKAAAAAFVASASVFGAALVSTPVLRVFAWRLHDFLLPDMLHGLISQVVPGSGRSGDVLSLWTGRELNTVRLTWEGLGLYEVWYLLVGLSVFEAFAGKGKTVREAESSLARAVLIIAAYAVLRYIVLTALAIELDMADLMWRPMASVVSWLPLACVLRLGEMPRAIPRSGAGYLAAAFMLGLGFAAGIGLEDPGCLKPGRVMIDEGHADWEWAGEPFDTTAYGIRAEYNYYCLREYLGHFYRVGLSQERVSRALLDTVDVLIIKTPTTRFAENEIDAIENFVAAGGGLLLIGDHTNLFGMTTHLNAIAGRFGMRFRSDDTFDIATTGFSCFRRPHTDSHPAARWVRKFGFLTSCSIDGGPRTRPVIVGCGLGSEAADYGHPNFFGNIRYDLCDRFGVFLQAASARFGEGRVMLFSDSTCFSNFCMFAPGRCELALGMVDYLNRRGERWPFLIPLGVGLTGALTAFFFVRARRRGRVDEAARALRAAFPVCIAGAAVGLLAVSHLNFALHGSLDRAINASNKNASLVLFDTSHSDVSFFTYPEVPRPSGTPGFEALYISVQRIGGHPRTGDLRNLSFHAHSGLVIVNPSRAFSLKDISRVDRYLNEGGAVLILDSITNGTSTANEILSRYGISLGPVMVSGAGSQLRLAVMGGMVLKREASGKATAVFVPVGEGTLIVATDSFRYSHHVLGSLLERGEPPDPVRAVYSELYGILRNLIRGGSADRGSADRGSADSAT